jgi:predicted lipoprotein with Yx(FWY)xxD motif
MKTTTIFLILLVVITTAFLAGCTQPQQQVQPTPLPVSPAPALTVMPSSDTIRVTDTTLGKILVDSTGKTLYYFASDIPASGASTCSGKCAVAWPVFSTDSIRVSSPLDPADFSSITRADGSRQTTYYGWPLYYYQADVNAGDVKGENVLKTWFVIKPDENLLIANSPALGLYLTDGSGKTLYYFAKDTPGTSACTGACLTKWPAFSAGAVSAPSVLAPADFSSAKRTDGITQTAFKDRLLYYFADDAKPGDVKGQGFNGVWYVANITGYVPVVSTPVPTTTPTPAPTSTPGSDGGGGGGGGGY